MRDPFQLDDDPLPEPAAARRGSGPPPYLARLNPAQREAVDAIDGPVLLLAGAGTGKTRALTARLAHLLATGQAWPRQILAVTFTNKAAREMRERVAALIGDITEGMWLGTFHALGARMVRRHAELVGLKSNFTILDTDDQLRLLKQIMEAEGVDGGRWPARLLLGVIQRWKDRGLAPDKVPRADVGDFANGRALALYAAYQERLKTLNAADFGDLLLHALTLLQSSPDVLAGYQRQFKYVLVDEYQDTNVAQYLWLRLLAQGHRNICCVGDDDQSIYGWRGAEVGNILRFEKDFPGARVIRLEQNYRSTGHILGAASGLIAANAGRLGKTLWTDGDAGDRVVVKTLWDDEEEARDIGEEIERLRRDGHLLAEIAILVRAGFQTRAFEERFITLGLPYRVVGGPRFYERQEIRDAIAYLRVVVQPDDDLAFERIVNRPKRGIGDATLRTLHGLARAEGISLFEAARRVLRTEDLPSRARNALRRPIADFERWQALLGAMPHVELAGTILDESGYTAMWQDDRSPEAPGRLENLKELVRALEEFESLQGFLEHVSLVMDNAEEAGGDLVSLMTLHAAKGLEFDTVFLPGWEEGLFPHQRALDESGSEGLEEERRLAYVGITRARRRVTITCAARRRMYNQWIDCLPSMFLDELPEEHVERIAGQGLYAGYGREPAVARLGAGERTSRFAGVHSGTVIDAQAWTVAPREPKTGAFAIGERVFHQKFGYGRIEDINDDKLEIAFEKAGRKRVLDGFVEKT